MGAQVAAACRRIAVALGAIVATMASVSGVIATIDWATDAFGWDAVLIAGAFLAGAVIMHGIDHARTLNRGGAARRPPSAT